MNREDANRCLDIISDLAKMDIEDGRYETAYIFCELKIIIKKLLDKHIVPKKIIDDKCPTCNSPILYSNGVHNNYCYVCGQRLE